MLFDAHSHIAVSGGDNIAGDNNLIEKSEYFKLFDEGKLTAILNATSEIEASVFSEIKNAYVSFGIHPWQTDRFSAKNFEKEIYTFLPLYEKADAIGEIGLDNYWCDCEPQLQMQIFQLQLEIAQKLNKPVILHIKGREKEALEEIGKFSGKKLIHWYSCKDFLQMYIDVDCYFSVGIDIICDNEISKNIAQKVPIEKLLVETDGIEAVKWATGKNISIRQMPDIILGSISKIAKIRLLSQEELSLKIEENFYRFLKA